MFLGPPLSLKILDVLNSSHLHLLPIVIKVSGILLSPDGTLPQVSKSIVFRVQVFLEEEIDSNNFHESDYLKDNLFLLETVYS